MIGIRTAIPAVLAVTLAGIGADGGGTGPETAIAADAAVASRAAEADARLEALASALDPALDAARRGAARIVAGDDSPAAELEMAAAALGDAEAAARSAGDAMRELDAARRARDIDAEGLEPAVTPAELASIAAQLVATAEAGEAFAAVRRDADEALVALDAALAALSAGDVDTAEVEVEGARRAHDSVAAWEAPPVTLPVWLDTMDAMIGAMEGIVEATRPGDTDAARASAEAFAALGDDAAVADRALRIAISEGGNAVSAPALGRLADAMASVDRARRAVARFMPVDQP